MTGLIIAAVVLIALAILRIGVSVEYSDDGLFVVLYVGFLRIKLYPKKIKRQIKSKKEKKKVQPETQIKKPGPSIDFKKLLHEALKVLSKLRRRLLIKELTVLCVQAGGDPFKMAITQGAALTALGLSQAALESFFRVKRLNLHTSVDFLADTPRVYVNATLTIAVWESVFLGFAALMLVLRGKKTVSAESSLEAAEQ